MGAAWFLAPVVVAAVAATPAGHALAQDSGPATPAQTQVFTRATLHSVFSEDQGRRHYVRLKLGPGSGLPFRTLSFRVRDPALLAPFAVGSSVAFVARRVDGENQLTALRAAPPLLRFETH